MAIRWQPQHSCPAGLQFFLPPIFPRLIPKRATVNDNFCLREIYWLPPPIYDFTKHTILYLVFYFWDKYHALLHWSQQVFLSLHLGIIPVFCVSHYAILPRTLLWEKERPPTAGEEGPSYLIGDSCHCQSVSSLSSHWPKALGDTTLLNLKNIMYQSPIAGQTWPCATTAFSN